MRIIIFIFLLIFLFDALPTHAVSVDLTPITDPVNIKNGDLSDLAKTFYQFGFAIAGLLAFGAIVYGGVLYASSGGSSEKQKEAREWIKGAIIGLLLLATAGLLLNLLNPGAFNID